MRYLGIDHGTRRIGLSWGEDGLGVAVPLPPILSPSPWAGLANVIHEKKIDALVLGHPFGRATSWTKQIECFGERLKKRFALPVHLVDERLTSRQVEEDLAAMGRRKNLAKLLRERRSGHVDSRAAVLLLQDFFDELRLAAADHSAGTGPVHGRLLPGEDAVP
ncbi:MAG: Holliday junction resolvase RuvX [Puniceicoccales bacterium]|jgi:putative Holliday junction resolvase|nr:Holliday junction resolvase RuvX [Puniceicoccales bacterium]